MTPGTPGPEAPGADAAPDAPTDGVGGDARGVSLLEVLISLVVLAVGVVGVAGLLYYSSQQARYGDRDTEVWGVAHQKMEDLLDQGYGNVSSGSETIRGYPVSWWVTGTDPEHIMVEVQERPGAPPMAPDTFVTYVSDPSS